MSVRKSFQTAKGTELPLLNLKGKEYLQVMHRLRWFREDHPDGAIKTEIVRLDMAEGSCVSKAEIMIYDKEKGNIVLLAVDYGSESKKDFPDYIEKSITKALGRALAVAGYGTQFASEELDEQHRIVDSPAPVLETTTSTATVTTTQTGGFKKVHKTESNGASDKKLPSGWT